MTFAYEGDKPYIFVSYAHKDSHAVLPVIEYLQAQGFRVWFDAGIEAGSEWPEYIASHLKNSGCVLTFISESFVNSHNCRRELNFAQEMNKPLLNIYIKEVNLTDGMKMQLGLNQAVYKKNFRSEEEFLEAVCRAKLISNCRDSAFRPQTDLEANGKPQHVQPSAAASEPEKPVRSTKIPALPSSLQSTRDRSGKWLFWGIIALELSFALFGPLCFRGASQITQNPGLLMLIMLIVHGGIVLVNTLLYRSKGKALSCPEQYDLTKSLLISAVFSSIIAFAVCPLLLMDMQPLSAILNFAVNSRELYYASDLQWTGWQLLVSAMLNAPPAVLAVFCYRLLNKKCRSDSNNSILPGMKWNQILCWGMVLTELSYTFFGFLLCRVCIHSAETFIGSAIMMIIPHAVFLAVNLYLFSVFKKQLSDGFRQLLSKRLLTCAAISSVLVIIGCFFLTQNSRLFYNPTILESIFYSLVHNFLPNLIAIFGYKFGIAPRKKKK
ncbi:MAG: toll/interleukin-1 receptor domain-containing protein [Ruminococcus sp.]|nr:toll/interleukin-1 receptor domain-containing protein [Ruminococcus sp.]